MMRLFCFPFAGGTASYFFDWSKQGGSLEVGGIEYPGRGKRWKEDAYDRVESLAEAIAAEVRPGSGEPYAFLGHSFGAIVATAVTHVLLRSGSPLPVRLCLVAARAPHLPHREIIHGLPDQEFLSRLLTYGGIPQEVLENKELLSLLMPIVREDFRLFEEYRYPDGEPLPVPISVFGGLQDTEVSTSDILAWRQHTTKSFRCRFYPGTHFFLYDPKFPVIKDIQDDINASYIPSIPQDAE